jgi:hypothetical protein
MGLEVPGGFFQGRVSVCCGGFGTGRCGAIEFDFGMEFAKLQACVESECLEFRVRE